MLACQARRDLRLERHAQPRLYGVACSNLFGLFLDHPWPFLYATIPVATAVDLLTVPSASFLPPFVLRATLTTVRLRLSVGLR
jgi:hypothetical protein